MFRLRYALPFLSNHRYNYMKMNNYSWKYQIIVLTSTVVDDSVIVLLTIATISVIIIIIIPRNHSVTLQ